MGMHEYDNTKKIMLENSQLIMNFEISCMHCNHIHFNHTGTCRYCNKYKYVPNITFHTLMYLSGK